MKIAIMYESKTGNTETIAEAIRDEIDAEVCYFGAPKDVDADLYVIGSWTDKGVCTADIAATISGLKDARIAYFCTAGFGESAEYFDRLTARAKSLVDPTSEFVGAFCCQGKMPASVRVRYVDMLSADPTNERLQLAITNFDKAADHPNAEDITHAKAWIRDIIKRLK